MFKRASNPPQYTLEQLLNALGDTRQKVAHRLKARGYIAPYRHRGLGIVVGKPGENVICCRVCPVALYLRDNGYPDIEVGTTAVRDMHMSTLCRLPVSVRDFIAYFDAGRFPSLETR